MTPEQRGAADERAAGWNVVTSYRELGPSLTAMEELRRDHYRWRWLAMLARGRPVDLLKDDGRWFYVERALVPADHRKADHATD